MTPETILALTMLCGGGWGLLLWLPRRKRRNRRVSGSAWSCRSAHPSFWNNDRRGHTECR